MTAPRTAPTVRRRIVASELRRLRRESGKTQGEVETACDLTNNALSRFETCKSGVQAPIARTLFTYYGVVGEQLESLVDLARGSRRSGLLTSGTFPPWLEDYLALEADASGVMELALTAIPGPWQTQDYARAMLRGGRLGSEVEEHVKTRMRRAQHLLEPEAPQFWGIMRESVLHCEVGGKAVMKAQLEHLVELASAPNITMLVLPNTHGAHMSMLTSFILLRFAIAPDFGVAYTEHLGGALYQDDEAEVALYDEAFERLKISALPEEQSVQLIKKTIKDRYT